MVTKSDQMPENECEKILDRFFAYDKNCLEAGYDYPDAAGLPDSKREIAVAILSRAKRTFAVIGLKTVTEVFKPKFLSLSRYHRLPNSNIANFCSHDLEARRSYGDTFSKFLDATNRGALQLELAWEKTFEQADSQFVFVPKSFDTRSRWMSSEASIEIVHEFASQRANGSVSESDLKKAYAQINGENFSSYMLDDSVFATVYAFALVSFESRKGFITGVDREWLDSAPFMFGAVPSTLTMMRYGAKSPSDLGIAHFSEGQFYLKYWWYLYDAIQDRIKIQTSQWLEPEGHVPND